MYRSREAARNMPRRSAGAYRTGAAGRNAPKAERESPRRQKIATASRSPLPRSPSLADYLTIEWVTVRIGCILIPGLNGELSKDIPYDTVVADLHIHPLTIDQRHEE